MTWSSTLSDLLSPCLNSAISKQYMNIDNKFYMILKTDSFFQYNVQQFMSINQTWKCFSLVIGDCAIQMLAVWIWTPTVCQFTRCYDSIRYFCFFSLDGDCFSLEIAKGRGCIDIKVERKINVTEQIFKCACVNNFNFCLFKCQYVTVETVYSHWNDVYVWYARKMQTLSR